MSAKTGLQLHSGNPAGACQAAYPNLQAGSSPAPVSWLRTSATSAYVHGAVCWPLMTGTEGLVRTRPWRAAETKGNPTV